MGTIEKKTRFERYLAFIADHLGRHGFHVRLIYDDYRGGNVLVMAARTPAGLGELVVERHRMDRATLILCAASSEAARCLSEALAGQHLKIKRRHTAMRAFSHRVERMADELWATYEARAAEFPMQPLAALRQLVPEAAPLIGVEGLIHGREHDQAAQIPATLARQGGKQRRRARRYPSRFAARIPTPQGDRAALCRPIGAFAPRGETLVAVLERLSHLPPEQWPEAAGEKGLVLPALEVDRTKGQVRVKARVKTMGSKASDVLKRLDAIHDSVYAVDTAADIGGAVIDAGSSVIEAVGEAGSGCSDFGSVCDVVEVCGVVDCG